MDSLVKLITSLAPFLSAYPLWVKGLFSFWVVLTAVLFLAFVLMRTAGEQTAPDRAGALQTPPMSSTQAEAAVDSRIRDLLGKERKDITAYLGEPEDATVFKPTAADVDMGRSFDTTYLSYKRHGVTFLLWGATVKTIFLNPCSPELAAPPQADLHEV